MNVYDILKYKRSIEIWDTIWYDEITKIRRKLLKLDNASADPIIIQISGENDAKSESMVLFDLMQMIQADIHTVGAGGLEGLNGLIFLAGNTKVAYPNMWLKPWWPIKQNMDLMEGDMFSAIPYETSLNRLEDHIVDLFATQLKMNRKEYQEFCFSNDVLLASDLLDNNLIDTIIHKDSNWLVDILKT
jgi:ATP-dependent protease ClpP protease subunit